MSFQDFSDRLREAQILHASDTIASAGLSRWMHYWNDAESDLSNLRNFQHWLERAQQRVKDNSLAHRGRETQ